MSRTSLLNKYNDEYISRLIDHDIPLYRIARQLGVCRQTLSRYVKHNPSLSRDYEYARHRLIAKLLARFSDSPDHALALFWVFDKLNASEASRHTGGLLSLRKLMHMPGMSTLTENIT